MKSLTGLLLICLSMNANAERFVSSSQATPVVELFTSQGCSSCPPAERWLSGLADEPGLWQEFIPLAWHVDYWNDLGWPDVFSSPAYSDRERQYARSGGLSQVYTPAVLVAGQEFRRWRWRSPLKAPAGPEVGTLLLEIDGDQARVRFDRGPAAPAGTLISHLVLVGQGHSTPIERGENRGRELREDFVVLGHTQISGSGPDFSLRLPQPAVRRAARYAAVAWISQGADPAPIQATGGWLQAR